MKKWIYLFFLLSATLFAEPSLPPGSRDKYKKFAQLAAEKTEGVDFLITALNRQHPVTIFAIHGGKIEIGTSELALAIAGEDYNLYLFEGILPENNFTELHLTSNNFDEPRALNLAASSIDCLSLHGFADKLQERICLGGLNFPLIEKVANALRELEEPPVLNYFCKNLEGKGETNIVNRCQNKGVQLEFSSKLRNRLITDKKQFDEITNKLKGVIFQNASNST